MKALHAAFIRYLRMENGVRFADHDKSTLHGPFHIPSCSSPASARCNKTMRSSGRSTSWRASATDPLPARPDKDGKVRWETLYPLYPTVPQAVRGNPALHELPTLFGAIWAVSPHERAPAIQELDQRRRAEAPATQSAQALLPDLVGKLERIAGPRA